MNWSLHAPILMLAILILAPVSAAPEHTLHFSSGETQIPLIELYTSEGCSSCPPADHWLGQLLDSKLLWHALVPVAFHVDYWDQLGWQDPYADARFSQRQYRYRTLGHVRSVYTPGIMVNGREWRGWHWGLLPEMSAQNVGTLKASLGQHFLMARFQTRNGVHHLVLNIAWLGMDLHSHVARGENRGRTLQHDFVVLALQQFTGQADGNEFNWNVPRATPDLRFRAIAIWVSRPDDPTPIQASGSWLPRN